MTNKSCNSYGGKLLLRPGGVNYVAFLLKFFLDFHCSVAYKRLLIKRTACSFTHSKSVVVPHTKVWISCYKRRCIRTENIHISSIWKGFYRYYKYSLMFNDIVHIAQCALHTAHNLDWLRNLWEGFSNNLPLWSGWSLQRLALKNFNFHLLVWMGVKFQTVKGQKIFCRALQCHINCSFREDWNFLDLHTLWSRDSFTASCLLLMCLISVCVNVW